MTNPTRLATIALLGLIAASAHAATIPPVIRGQRTILLRSDGGPLTIKVYKRDLNIYPDLDTLTAEVYDPVRLLRAKLEIADDGSTGKGAATELQSAETTIQDAIPGTYLLRVTGSGDMVYGLQTTAPGALVGGEIFLNDPAIPGRVYFMPPAAAFTITARAVHPPGAAKVPLLDDKQQVVTTFDLAPSGDKIVYKVPEGPRGGLWYFDIPHMDVSFTLDKPAMWTADSTAWFAADKSKWMLLPYSQMQTVLPGKECIFTVQLRNRTGVAESFKIETRSEDGLKLTLGSQKTALVAQNELTNVDIGGEILPHVRRDSVLRGTVSVTAVGDPTVQASAALLVKVSPSLIAPSDKPIVLKPYQHESMQYGYAPDYIPNEVYFDLRNHPWMRERTESVYGSTGVQLLEKGQWVLRPFIDAIKAAYPDYRTSYGAGGFLGAKFAFDGDGGAYTMLQLSLDKTRQAVLLYTPDRGQPWQVVPVGPGGSSSFDIEQFVGHNALKAPPPILEYRFVKPHEATFAGYHDLYLYLPKKEAGKLVMGEPVKVAENCFGSCQHSGGPASTATLNGKTHIVWGEVTDPKDPGAPTYIATYDHTTDKVGEKVLLGYAPPVNDVHNVPAIAQDSQGYIHVILGAHGKPFQYTRSLKPNDAYSGWTKPEPVLSAGWKTDKSDADGDGGQTYCSLVCDANDTLHIAFRQWRRNADEHHPDQLYAALSVQSKPKDGPWSPARPVVIPPVPGYSIYYHKLTIDRQGRLYLSYSYWTDHPYQDDFPDRYHNRALVVSTDGGKSWKLALDEDFRQVTK
ncbi:MAG: BNR-4 repeat-containing protein [Armatimonadia bacterium]